jgi:hypothetical protein
MSVGNLSTAEPSCSTTFERQDMRSLNRRTNQHKLGEIGEGRGDAVPMDDRVDIAA